jgi:hypothetical protein
MGTSAALDDLSGKDALGLVGKGHAQEQESTITAASLHLGGNGGLDVDLGQHLHEIGIGNDSTPPCSAQGSIEQGGPKARSLFIHHLPCGIHIAKPGTVMAIGLAHALYLTPGTTGFAQGLGHGLVVPQCADQRWRQGCKTVVQGCRR